MIFLEIGSKKYNMGDEILDSFTHKPTIVMERKKSDATEDDKIRKI
jgi:hypothetical protein